MPSTPQQPELPPTPTQSPRPSPATDGVKLPATTPDSPARFADRPAPASMGMYELLREVNRGGMGIVYKARHLVLDRLVALKMMRGDARDWPQEKQRFEREMRAAARLNHPHILPIYETGWHRERPFYTMPYVAGGSLAAQRAHLRMNPEAALRLMAKVAQAVQFAHEAGVVHRDLKPANILLDEHGQPLVTDFGLAKLQNENVELTQTGDILGTPGYMAPEQASGRTRDIGPHTDVWALGVMLYEMLTGRRPFMGDNSEEVKQQIRSADPPRPRTLRPNLDAALERIILRCLHKQPARRYASAGELADDLDHFLRGVKTSRCPDPWRRLRSMTAALTMLGLLVLAMLATSGLARSPTPEALSPKAGAVKAGPLSEPIVLLDGRAAPAELHWIFGEMRVRVLNKPPHEPLTLASSDLNLLVLRAAPPWRRYRLEAEIEDKEGGNFARVGLFFALNRHQFAGSTIYTFWYVGFTERWLPSIQVKLDAYRVEDARSLPQRSGALPKSLRKYDPQKMAGPPPRRLAVEVTEEKVRAFWGNDCFREVSREELHTRNQGLVDELKGLHAPFSPQGSLGIFVKQGSAVFHRVVIRPLPDDHP